MIKLPYMQYEEYRRIPDTQRPFWVSESGTILGYRKRVGRFHLPRFMCMPVCTNNSGYAYVSFEKKKYAVHVLVGEIFISGKSSPYQVFNHKDCRKWYNHYSNLELISKAEDTKHMWGMGRHHVCPSQQGKFGESHPSSVFTEAEVVRIHEYFRAGMSRKDIAATLNESYSTINGIVSGRSWPHVYVRFHSTGE